MRLKLLAAISAALTIASLPVRAQISTNTPTPPSGITDLGNTVFGYFTSFNTNLDMTFHDNRGLLWTGVDTVRGGVHPLLNELGGSYDLFQPAHSEHDTSTAIFLEGVERNSGLLNTVTSVQGGIGFALIVHDVRLSLSGDCGYYLDTNGMSESQFHKLYGEVDVRAMKAFGPHFAGGVGTFVEFPNKAQGLLGQLTLTF